MARSITSSLTSSASKPFAPSVGLAHYAALLGIGALLALIHQGWDFHLKLPGHYGLVWMAGVMLTRHWSPARWAATGTVLGYIGGTALLTHGIHGGLMQTPVYALSTLVIDVAWMLGAQGLRRLALVALLGGVAFMLKPIAVYALADGFHVQLGTLRFGALFPLITHFCFGAVGAVIGTLMYGAGAKRDSQG
jgi:hypothetical protein